MGFGWGLVVVRHSRTIAVAVGGAEGSGLLSVRVLAFMLLFKLAVGAAEGSGLLSALGGNCFSGW